MDDYGFEYSDDDYIEEDVDIENQYYNSKGIFFSVQVPLVCSLFYVIFLSCQKTNQTKTHQASLR